MPPRIALLALLLAATPAAAQFNDPQLRKFADAGAITVEVTPAKAKRGQTVTYRVTMTPNAANNVWTYPIKPGEKAQEARTNFVFPPPVDLVFVAEPTDPVGHPWKTKPDINPITEEKFTAQYSTEPVTWELKAVVSRFATPGPKSMKLEKSKVQGCNNSNCLISRPADWPAANFEVLDSEPVPVETQFRDAYEQSLALLTTATVSRLVFQAVVAPRHGDSAPPQPPSPAGPRDNGRGKPETLQGPQQEGPAAGHYPPKEPKTTDQYRADLDALEKNLDTSELTSATSKDEGILAFMLTAAIWGLISLVTPCVFPMIPITVSIFLKHAHGSLGERMKLAGVYCLTIILVLGVSAFALLRFMAVLSADPITNVLLGLLFLVLALSLFGMFDLALPGFMARRLQAKQAKGGTLGMVFGALAFTVISFTCVAPFLGGFAGISAADSGNNSLIVLPTLKEVLGGLAFATAFAAPFFVLAMIPGLLKALPKSGGWLDSVKVVMGFLELAAALKFFRTAELRVFSPAEFFTYDMVLAGWVAISLACGLYLLNAYRLPHDEEKPHIGIPRLLFAVMFLGLGVYLLPGTLKHADGKPQRPGGAVYAWVDAFLLPEPKHLGWGTDLPDAVQRVRDEHAAAVEAVQSGKSTKVPKMRPIIIDFTGVTCTNCAYNENTVFPQAKVNEQLQEFERVQFYTDWVPADLYATDPGRTAREAEATRNDDFKYNVFKDQSLPLYAALVPTADGKVKVLGVYPEGKINKPDQFAKWLKDMREKAKKS